MSDPYSDPNWQRYFEHCRKELFPKLKTSGLSLTILSGDPDPKLCMELGAALLFEKPLIILAVKGTVVPAAIRRLAERVIEVDELDAAASKAVEVAIEEVMENHYPEIIGRRDD